jgi:DNA-binding transcriptional ArsR family regulator
MTAPLPKHDVFQAIADPTRRGLLKLLVDQEMPVTVISGHFPMSRTAVSKHLRILADAGLVKERKVGRETRYRFNPDPLLELKRWLSYLVRLVSWFTLTFWTVKRLSTNTVYWCNLRYL